MKNKLFILSIFLLTSCLPIARIVKYIPAQRISKIEFSNNQEIEYPFYYSNSDEPYFKTLQKEINNLDFNLETNDLRKVEMITNWSNKQWEHSGNNQPTKPDAVTILQEAKRGKKFRCVEYGILNASLLNYYGLKARVIGLKAKDVEVVKYAGGHVASEVFLPSLKKWIFADAQFNIIPYLNNVPLNAVELQHAIFYNKENLKLKSNGTDISESEKKNYIKFISKYLYFFDINFDNRVSTDVKRTYNGHQKLMLVPINVTPPRKFQRSQILDIEITNSNSAFYPK